MKVSLRAFAAAIAMASAIFAPAFAQAPAKGRTRPPAEPQYKFVGMPSGFAYTMLTNSRSLVGYTTVTKLGQNGVNYATVDHLGWNDDLWQQRRESVPSMFYGAAPDGSGLYGLLHQELWSEKGIFYFPLTAIWRDGKTFFYDPMVNITGMNSAGNIVATEFLLAKTNGEGGGSDVGNGSSGGGSSDPISITPLQPRIFRQFHPDAQPDYYGGRPGQAVSIDPDGNVLINLFPYKEGFSPPSIETVMEPVPGSHKKKRVKVAPDDTLPTPIVWMRDGTHVELPEGVINDVNSAGTMAAGSINGVATLWVGNRTQAIYRNRRNQVSEAMAVNDQGDALINVTTYLNRRVSTTISYLYKQVDRSMTPLTRFYNPGRGWIMAGTEINNFGDIAVSLFQRTDAIEPATQAVLYNRKAEPVIIPQAHPKLGSSH